MPDYDLNHPEVFEMPKELNEISGIAFHKSDSGKIYAIQDEEGIVYHQKLGGKIWEMTRFAKHGDFEDIAISGFYFLILRSEGSVFTFPLDNISRENALDVKVFKNILPAGEYEGLYADGRSNQIVALCKNCAADKKSGHLSAYILQQDSVGNLQVQKNVNLNLKDIERLSSTSPLKFKPSALALNQLTEEWYILSSVNKMLVITDSNWKVKQVYKLDPSIYNQPEGINFDIDNNLYISNERGQKHSGTILKLRFKSHGK